MVDSQFVELFGIDDKASARDVRDAFDRIGLPQPERLILLDEREGQPLPYRGAGTRAIVKTSSMAAAAALRAACQVPTIGGRSDHGEAESKRRRVSETRLTVFRLAVRCRTIDLDEVIDMGLIDHSALKGLMRPRSIKTNYSAYQLEAGTGCFFDAQRGVRYEPRTGNYTHVESGRKYRESLEGEDGLIEVSPTSQTKSFASTTATGSEPATAPPARHDKFWEALAAGSGISAGRKAAPSRLWAALGRTTSTSPLDLPLPAWIWEGGSSDGAAAPSGASSAPSSVASMAGKDADPLDRATGHWQGRWVCWLCMRVLPGASELTRHRKESSVHRARKKYARAAIEAHNKGLEDPVSGQEAASGGAGSGT